MRCIQLQVIDAVSIDLFLRSGDLITDLDDAASLDRQISEMLAIGCDECASANRDVNHAGARERPL